MVYTIVHRNALNWMGVLAVPVMMVTYSSMMESLVKVRMYIRISM